MLQNHLQTLHPFTRFLQRKGFIKIVDSKLFFFSLIFFVVVESSFKHINEFQMRERSKNSIRTNVPNLKKVNIDR